MHPPAHEPARRYWLTLLMAELRQHGRARWQWVSVAALYVLAVVLYPLALGPDGGTLRQVGPGVLWVAALLAAMLSFQRMCRADRADGTLDQWRASAVPLLTVALAKALAHWLMMALPLLVLTPLLALMLQLPTAALPVAVAVLLPGTLALTLYGLLGASLTLQHQGAGILLLVLVLPLSLPVLVFGAGALHAAVMRDAALTTANLYLLAAATLAAFPLTLPAVAWLWRRG